jgi:hypothetical protein
MLQGQPSTVFHLCTQLELTFIHSSQVPTVVEDWRSELRSKNRPKLAARIADPVDQPELFEEGWAEALESEKTNSADGVLVDV